MHGFPWLRAVIVDTSRSVAARAKSAYRMTTAPVRAVLTKATIKRSSKVAQRLEELLLLSRMSQKAQLEISRYIYGFPPPPLLSEAGRSPQLRTPSGLRLVPRIETTPYQYLWQQTDPVLLEYRFYSRRSHPAGWVATGS